MSSIRQRLKLEVGFLNWTKERQILNLNRWKTSWKLQVEFHIEIKLSALTVILEMKWGGLCFVIVVNHHNYIMIDKYTITLAATTWVISLNSNDGMLGYTQIHIDIPILHLKEDMMWYKFGWISNLLNNFIIFRWYTFYTWTKCYTMLHINFQ